MKIFITCDCFWESKIDEVVFALDDIGYENYFCDKDYGNSLKSITVIFVCQNSNLGLKQRIRYSKIKKHIQIDIMLDLKKMVSVGFTEKKNVMVKKLISEVPIAIKSKKLDDFQFKEFVDSFQNYMRKAL